jgi:hypothetical protein
LEEFLITNFGSKRKTLPLLVISSDLLSNSSAALSAISSFAGSIEVKEICRRFAKKVLS